jgi:hypothetical protein
MAGISSPMGRRPGRRASQNLDLEGGREIESYRHEHLLTPDSPNRLLTCWLGRSESRALRIRLPPQPVTTNTTMPDGKRDVTDALVTTISKGCGSVIGHTRLLARGETEDVVGRRARRWAGAGWQLRHAPSLTHGVPGAYPVRSDRGRSHGPSRLQSSPRSIPRPVFADRCRGVSRPKHLS